MFPNTQPEHTTPHYPVRFCAYLILPSVPRGMAWHLILFPFLRELQRAVRLPLSFFQGFTFKDLNMFFMLWSPEMHLSFIVLLLHSSKLYLSFISNYCWLEVVPLYYPHSNEVFPLLQICGPS